MSPDLALPHAFERFAWIPAPLERGPLETKPAASVYGTLAMCPRSKIRVSVDITIAAARGVLLNAPNSPRASITRKPWIAFEPWGTIGNHRATINQRQAA